MQALNWRRAGDCKNWQSLQADEHGVRLAMIYDDWLPCSLEDQGWVRMGSLWTDDAAGAFLGGPEVTFYARNTVEALALQADFADWLPGLPEGARWEAAK